MAGISSILSAARKYADSKNKRHLAVPLHYAGLLPGPFL
jgi:hypothetical protein